MENKAKVCRVAGLCLLVTFSTVLVAAQTTPTGQVVAPGTQQEKKTNTANCGAEAPSTAANGTDSNCAEVSPGFALPALDTVATDRPREIIAFVRVDAVVPRPPVALPAGDSFSVVGGATLVRVHRTELGDCLATGKRIRARAGAPTSTTCLDRKGELLAYQECGTGAADCLVLTPEAIAKQQVAGGQPGPGKVQ